MIPQTLTPPETPTARSAGSLYFSAIGGKK